ncbi:hypothetical protein HKX48_004955 [Thoreauomyces humboldtii]|nr:hypothetical protein HKX48_004955 [Thoreauomyces humboldtii]
MSNPYNLANGEFHFRDHLLDSLMADLTTLQRHAWISNQHFDILLQRVTFEKVSPGDALAGLAPASAGAGVPLSSIQEDAANEGTDLKLGIITLKSYNSDRRAKKAAILPRNIEHLPAYTPSQGSGRIAIVTADFQSGEEGDLPLRMGQKVDILEEIDENWYRGRCAGAEGIFPKGFIKEVK